MATGRKKGCKKTGGRVAGTPNKTTAVTRNIINEIASGMVDQVMKDIAELEPKDRVHLWVKLCEFNVSKPQSIDLGVTAGSKATIEATLEKLSEENEK